CRPPDVGDRAGLVSVEAIIIPGRSGRFQAARRGGFTGEFGRSLWCRPEGHGDGGGGGSHAGPQRRREDGGEGGESEAVRGGANRAPSPSGIVRPITPCSLSPLYVSAALRLCVRSPPLPLPARLARPVAIERASGRRRVGGEGLGVLDGE